MPRVLLPVLYIVGFILIITELRPSSSPSYRLDSDHSPKLRKWAASPDLSRL